MTINQHQNTVNVLLNYWNINLKSQGMLQVNIIQIWWICNPSKKFPPETWTPTPPHQTPSNLTTPKKKTVNFFVQFKCATHRWVGPYKPPVAAHSPLCTRHFSYTIPQKTQQYMYVYMLMHYHKSFCTVPQLAAWLTMFLSAHVQYLCEAFA